MSEGFDSWVELYLSQQQSGTGCNDLYLKPDGSGALLCQDDYYTKELTTEEMRSIYNKLKEHFEGCGE